MRLNHAPSFIVALALAARAQNTTTSVASSTVQAASTSVPTPTAALTSLVEQLPAPPVQAWCQGGGNASYCAGPLLQYAELAELYGDSKTFPDKPTTFPLNQTLAAFNALPKNLTVGQIEDFVKTYFKGEGLELVPAQIQGFTENPDFLGNVTDPLYQGFAKIVNGYWALLVRETNQSALCVNGACDSSLIPLNNSVVVPGARYRELYYWDSFWILEGLLKSHLYIYAHNLLENFMDLVDLYGFIPNGGRKYYLNRSQPPVFIQMLNTYVAVTGNVTILERGLRIAETELQWWRTNRTITVTSPYTGRNHSVARFSVTNSAPRPEGYLEDISTAFGGTPPLNESQRSELYAEIASGAESGWDYSSRYCKQPLLNLTDNDPALRTLNTRAIIPVDLNALLYGGHTLLANLYIAYMNSPAFTNSSRINSTSIGNMTAQIAAHRMIANETKVAILDLFWDPTKSFFYDFNTTSKARSDIYMPGGLFPLWQNITPVEVMGNDTNALKMFSGVRYIMGKYAGIPSVATLLSTGLNWDFPNSWPPHVYTSIKALETISRVNPNSSIIAPASLFISNYSAIPAGQLGLNESQLQPQPTSVLGNGTAEYSKNLRAIQEGKPWPQALAIEYANRYLQASFCSWYSSGGSIPSLLPQLSQAQLNSTGAPLNGTGNIFEKFNATDVDAAGGGGEYVVVVGFGWTNGVILHTSAEYGKYLVQPSCPLIGIVPVSNTTRNTTSLYSAFRIPGRD